MRESNKVKNRIIALSGQPVTGKSTTVKFLVEQLKKQGYSEENIHIFITGHKFRDYHNMVVEFINDLENLNTIDELEKIKQLRSIVQNPEYRQALINTIIKVKENNIDLSNFSIAQANNSKEFEEIRKVIDTIIDGEVKELGNQINQEAHPKEIWIVDSRLAFNNIPEAFSVRLTSNANIAAKRIFNDSNRGKEDKYKTIEEAKIAREERRKGEQKRYLQRYGVDLEDENNYDLIIDTSYSSPEDIADTINTCLNRYMEDTEFAKTWTSPKTLLPLQRELDTYGTQLYSFEELLDIINKHGYIPNQSIDVVEVEGRKYIIEGHHRNFCSAYLGRTLVPYEILAKDDEKIPYYGNTARQRANALNTRDLIGHEGIIAAKDPEFSYNDIYPGIYEELERKEGLER